MMGLEWLFRQYYEIGYFRFFELLALNFILLLLTGYIKSRIILLVTFGYFIFSLFSQMLTLSVFGYWLPPMYLVLFYENFGEALRSSTDSIYTSLPALIIALAISVLFIVHRHYAAYKKTKIADGLTILLLVSMPIHILMKPNRVLGEMPAIRNTALKAGYYTNSYFLGRTLPSLLSSDDQSLAFYQEAYPLGKEKVKNVIVIMGESLSSSYVSAFNYELETTPWLNQFKQNNHVIMKEAYASGLFTDIAVPQFFNMITDIHGDNQITSRRTNLFKMAKNNGYQTYFISAQSQDALGYMVKTGVEYIDDYVSSRTLGYDTYANALDMELLPWLTQVDLNQSNFFVINMSGSHEPYTERVPVDFKPFGSSNYLDNYHNTVAYTDQVLNKIFQYFIDQSIDESDILIIFTSDHGQMVTTKNMGKGNFEFESNYLVPAILYSPNSDIRSLYFDQFQQCERLYHHQLFSLVGNALGYQVPMTGCDSGVINGLRMNGSGGAIYIKNGQITKR